ncbi:MAG: hypothetical protein ACREKS_24375 [Candidatus Rokuibacteriota bacterium]
MSRDVDLVEGRDTAGAERELEAAVHLGALGGDAEQDTRAGLAGGAR